jgi:hypothetical protein
MAAFAISSVLSIQLPMFWSTAWMMRSCRSGSIRRQPPQGDGGSALSLG